MLHLCIKKTLLVTCIMAFGIALLVYDIFSANGQSCDLSSVLSSEDSWPMFQHDPQHTGFTNSTIPSTIRQKWNFTTFGKGAIQNAPIVADGLIFFGSSDGNFYALNETTGTVIWFRTIGEATTSAAVDTTRKLVFVACGANLYALDSVTGTTRWISGNSARGSPIINADKGLLFIGGIHRHVDYYGNTYDHAELLAKNETNGNLLWESVVSPCSFNNHPPYPWVYTSPASHAGRVIVGCDGGGYDNGLALLWCVDENTGSMLWSKYFGQYQRSSASLAFGLVFFGASDKNFYALNETTGETVWQRLTEDAIESSPAIDKNNELVFVGSNDGKLYAFSKVGTDIWQHDFGTAVKSSPIIGDNKVLITVGNKLYALNESDGQEIWNFQSTGNLTSPVVSNGVIFVGSTDGHLYALFSAEKIPTALSDPSTSVTYSHSTLISTRLSDKNGTAIPNANVTFSLYYNNEWNPIGWQTTNAQGDASISYTANISAGTYDLKVYYAGDFFYDPTYSIGKLDIKKEPTSLTFHVSPIEVNYDDTVEVSTCLKDDENNPINGISILYQIFVNNTWTDIGSNLTDLQGTSRITYSASIPPGTYPIKASFEDNSYENRTAQATLLIHKEITQISDPSTVVTYNDITQIQARLQDDEGIPISGTNVTFWIYYNDVWNQIGSTTTNTNGYAKINFFVTLEPNTYGLKARFDGNDFYLSHEYVGTLTIYSRVIIDYAFSSKERADVGSVQSVYFHAKWQYNGTPVNGGIIYINSTRLTINATGWAELLVTSPKAGLHTWTVTSINCNGATVFTQTATDPYIIWDEITITLSVQSSRVDVGTEITINISATYAYDGQPFNGLIILNDTVFKLSSIGKKSYTITHVNDPIRGLTTFKSNTITVIWDRIEVILQTTKLRINVGESAPITINAFYAYDNQPFIGTVILNDTSLVSTIVTKKSYTVTNVIDHMYNVSSFKTNTVSVIWDKVEVAIATEHTRVDIGRNISFTIRAFYSYDQQPFSGTILLNDTSTVAYSPTRKTYTVSQITDQLYGLTSYSSNSISVIWDEVIITLHVEKQRIKVGESANITIEAKYSYNNQQFSGQIILNDTIFSLSFVGKKSYTVASIADDDYYITRFSSNSIYVIWDNIQAEYSISNTSPGSIEVLVKLSWEYDGTPITNADLSIGNVKATNKGNGIYLFRISNWNPVLGSELIISTDNSQPIRLPIAGILLQNFLLELVLLPITFASVSGVVAYRWRKKRQALLKLLKDLDPKILGVAKNYGGILTKSVIAYELKTSLEIAEECLERFVKVGEAQKITKANLEIYDFASARTHLTKVDNKIITALRDNFRGLPKHELLEATGLTLEPLEESLEQLEKNDIIAFDKVTKEYRLKGIVMGKIRCANCNELVDVMNGKCSKCGATI